MGLPAQKTWTLEEYLVFDRASELRHEFMDGQVYVIAGGERQLVELFSSTNTIHAMAGGSVEHATISANLVIALGIQFRGTPCRVLSEARVSINLRNYFYPDVTVVCGTPEVEDGRRDTLLNPIVIFEVLSPSTEKYDRGAKAQQYRTLLSLQTYVLVSQETPHIEVYTRHGNGFWMLSEAVSLSEDITIPALNVVLPLSEVYARVFTADNT